MYCLWMWREISFDGALNWYSISKESKEYFLRLYIYNLEKLVGINSVK